MQVAINDELILDSRRAVWLPRTRTLVVADLFLGLGAARRRKPELQGSTHQELWERLVSLLDDLKPAQVAVLGDIKPLQGQVEAEEREELRQLLKKLGHGGRKVIQVVGHPDRAQGPALADTGVVPVEQHRVGPYALLHRRRIFVYPRLEPGAMWINGGVHPLFALPAQDPSGQADWLRVPAFLHTGYALILPPFVPWAQGFEVIQPERLPKHARAWSLLSDRLAPLDLPNLPAPPAHLAALAQRAGKRRETPGGGAGRED
ncbi:MAG TPA: hypothetical protein VFM16_01910 [Holophagaceae bacterium]|nr:hypothetical protein [Holophagaceae bacterium]